MNFKQFEILSFDCYGEQERTDPAEFPNLEVPDLTALVKIINMEFDK